MEQLESKELRMTDGGTRQESVRKKGVGGRPTFVVLVTQLEGDDSEVCRFTAESESL
jgi:hypothetical protein